MIKQEARKSGIRSIIPWLPGFLLRPSVFLGKHNLLVGLAICAGLHLASIRATRITPAHAEVSAATEGSFERDGQYPGEVFAGAVILRAWGSWSGSDDNMGSIAIGPFPAPAILRFGLSGYPNHDGNFL